MNNKNFDRGIHEKQEYSNSRYQRDWSQTWGVHGIVPGSGILFTLSVGRFCFCFSLAASVVFLVRHK